MVLRLVALIALAGCDSFFGLTIGPDVGRDAVIPAEACPTSYDWMIGTKHYKWVATYRLWPDAQADCVGDSVTKITHLPVVEDLAELAEIQGQVPAGGWRIPMGYARDNVEPASYRSVTGVPLPAGSELWTDVNQPDGGDETIVELSYQSELYDAPLAMSARHYFCQCDGIPATEVFSL